MTLTQNDVTVIGTGPAGLTAAIYAARGGLKTQVFAGIQHGGQLTTTTEVENFPGFPTGITGPKLMSDMAGQAERFGAEIVFDEITRTELKPTSLRLWAGDREIASKTVIIATGATAKTLGLPSESSLMGRGLSTCATCDGFFYRNKRVVVVGGGDSAMEEAYYLANLCSEVILMHRRPVWRASHVMLERAKKHPRIKFLVPFGVADTIAGPQGLTGLIIEHAETRERQQLDVDGLFMAIGHTPNSSVFTEWLAADEQGYLKVYDGVKTKVPGVFAAGDIADHVFRQAITAAGLGCQAGMLAIRHVEQLGQ